MTENNLSENQYTYGKEKVLELCTKYNLPESTMVKLLIEVNTLTGFYNWVNADYFLNIREGELKK